MEPGQDLLPCRPAWVPYAAEERIKTGAGFSHGTPGDAGVSCAEEYHHPV